MQEVVYELNRDGARLARRAALKAERLDGKRRFVAGALGPTNRTASISPDVNNPGFRAVTFDELRDAYAEQIAGLIDGGADLILIETIFDTLNAKAAIFACEEAFAAHGRAPAAHDLRHDHRPLRPHALGPDADRVLAFGAPRPPVRDRPQLRARRGGDARASRGDRRRRRHVRLRLSQRRPAQRIRPLRRNAGRRWRPRSAASRATASSTSSAAAAARRPRISRRSPRPSRGVAPRASRAVAPLMRLSGLEPLTLTKDIPFVNVGERTNVTGSAKFRKLITAGDYAGALAVARDQVANGAQIIDVNMDEGLIDSGARDGRVPQPRRRRARHRARAGDDRFLEVLGDRGGPEMRAGQGARQFDLDEGGRGGVPAPGAAGARLRRRGRRDGVRRTGPGRHARAQGRDLRARLQAAHRAGGLPARGHRLRPQHLRRRHRHRGAQRLRRRLHRGDAANPREPAARPHLRRRLQSVVLVPRQRAGARGDARGVPLSRDPGRHGHGHRQRRPARRLRDDRRRAARGLRGRGAQPPRRRDRAAARDRRALSRRRGQGGQGAGSRAGASSRSTSASPMRWSTASPTSSTPTPRRRASPPRARCTSSRGR